MTAQKTAAKETIIRSVNPNLDYLVRETCGEEKATFGTGVGRQKLDARPPPTTCRE